MVDRRKIQKLREAAGLTVTEVSGKIGTSKAFLSYVERGLKQPSAAVLKKLADILGTTMNDLMKEDD